MPGTVRPVADERDGLLAYLRHMRASLRSTVHGLTDEQARLKPVPSSDLTLGGLIKHAALCERGWVAGIVAHQLSEELSQRDWSTEFTLQEGETLAWALGLLDEVEAETEAIIAAIPDLGQPVPVPKGVPWFPQDVEAWSVRWVLLHLIQEQARHGGHADIIREALDGKTYYELLAASEGWTMPWASGE
jgi:uncharacterized damage-inducible protein DinB